jgi:hypothetical protein
MTAPKAPTPQLINQKSQSWVRIETEPTTMANWGNRVRKSQRSLISESCLGSFSRASAFFLIRAFSLS